MFGALFGNLASIIQTITTGVGIANSQNGIPGRDSAMYPSISQFEAFMREQDNHPSYTNLFSVAFSSPPVVRKNFTSRKFVPERDDLRKLLNYYCNNVSLPSKQITSGQVVNVGSAVKYATGSTFSQVNMNFVLGQSQLTRTFFERWMSVMANDANQYTEFYDDYVCPHVRIYKWERFGGDLAAYDQEYINQLRQAGDLSATILAKKYKVTGCWELRKVFPYNIGTIQLNNNASQLANITIGFYYERYRFFPESSFDDYGITNTITVPNDGYWDGRGDASITDTAPGFTNQVTLPVVN